jgi:hypothetical protein
MDPVSVLQIAAASLSVVAAAKSVAEVIKKRMAERNLYRELHNAAWPAAFEKTVKSLEAQVGVDHTKLAEIKEELNKVLAKLDEADRKYILEGLSQPSERSQVNYIHKLLDESTKVDIEM